MILKQLKNPKVDMPNFYIVNVKHGNSAVLIDTKGIVIVDAGNGSNLLEFLLSKKITVIDVLLLSHSDSDHIGGVMALLDSGIVDIKNIYINPDAIKNSETWDSLVWTLYNCDKDNKINFQPSITPDLTGTINQGMVNIEILAPNKYLVAKGSGGNDRDKRKITTNSISAVVRLIYKENPIILLAGDIDKIGLDNLLNDNKSIKSWLLVFPHHGGHARGDIKEFTKQICQLVQPEQIVFSIGDNTNRFPLKEVVETISENLQNTCMYTTNHSDVFQSHISQITALAHQNAVGHIHIDFTLTPLVLNFITCR
jgi:competence protein ComEC